MPKKKCPKGMKRNPKTGRCKTPCGRGRQVNPRTNRCVTKSYLRTIQGLSDDLSDNFSDTFDDFSDTFLSDTFSDTFSDLSDSDFDPDDYGVYGGHSPSPVSLSPSLRVVPQKIKPESHEDLLEVLPEPKENVSLEISRLKESLRLHERVSQDSQDLEDDSERVSQDLNAQADILDQLEDLEEYASERQLDLEFEKAQASLIDEVSGSDGFAEDVLVAFSTVPAMVLEELVDEIVDEELGEVAREVSDEFYDGMFTKPLSPLHPLDREILAMIAEVSLETMTVFQGLYKPGFHSTNCVSESHTTMSSLLKCGVYVVDAPFGRELVQRSHEMNALLWRTSEKCLLHPSEFIESFKLSKHGFNVSRCIVTSLGFWRITTFTADRSESEEREDDDTLIGFVHSYIREYETVTEDASSTVEDLVGLITQLLGFIYDQKQEFPSLSWLFTIGFFSYSNDSPNGSDSDY